MLDAVCFKRHTAQRGQAESLDSHDGLKPSPQAIRVFKRQHQPVCEAYCAFSPCHEKQNCLHTFSARCRPPGLQKRRGSEAGRNALDSKSSYGLIARTWVRIPPSPPYRMQGPENTNVSGAFYRVHPLIASAFLCGNVLERSKPSPRHGDVISGTGADFIHTPINNAMLRDSRQRTQKTHTRVAITPRIQRWRVWH